LVAGYFDCASVQTVEKTLNVMPEPLAPHSAVTLTCCLVVHREAEMLPRVSFGCREMSAMEAPPLHTRLRIFDGYT
jgi:hypothetical protein